MGSRRLGVKTPTAFNNKKKLFKQVNVPAAFVLTKRHDWFLLFRRTRLYRQMKARKTPQPGWATPSGLRVSQEG
jgi:hypothetical protein